MFCNKRWRINVFIKSPYQFFQILKVRQCIKQKIFTKISIHFFQIKKKRNTWQNIDWCVCIKKKHEISMMKITEFWYCKGKKWPLLKLNPEISVFYRFKIFAQFRPLKSVLASFLHFRRQTGIIACITPPNPEFSFLPFWPRDFNWPWL